MKRFFISFALVLAAGYAVAGDQCNALRDTGLRLLPRTVFDINYADPLNGCFAGYLPAGVSLEKGLYRFGIFRDGKLATSFPVIEAGMDLASIPFQHLKILGVAFNDVDQDGQRDVIVIGQRSIAWGELIFVQVYTGCGSRFEFDDAINSSIEEYTINKPVVNIKKVTQHVRSKNLKAACTGTP